MAQRLNYPVRRIALRDEGREDGIAHLTAEQRLQMVWPLTLQAWMFKEGRYDEPRLRRDVVRVVRRRG